MNIEQRLGILKQLGRYILSDDASWADTKAKASRENAWFIPAFIDYQLQHIAHNFLSEAALRQWVASYAIPDTQPAPRNVGIVMAGNIPLAGFHDFLAAFVSGHRQTIKPSSRDQALISGIVHKLDEWSGPDTPVQFAAQLRGCDAYIATGSNNSGRYFDYYFGKHPHIIRRNRSSTAILTGKENEAELSALADDVYLYFGLGCRNVTKIYVPRNYDFLPLLESFKRFDPMLDHHKYKNNYDYQLAIMIINKQYYMTNGAILLREDSSLFSPISQLHYEYYDDPTAVTAALTDNPDVQCVVGAGHLPFGQAQQPALDDYADRADTLRFLMDL